MEQMKGMFPDDDDQIQEAFDEASDATRSYMAARKAEQAAEDMPASKPELTPSQVTIAPKVSLRTGCNVRPSRHFGLLWISAATRSSGF
ncbi:hypothetical protein HDG37_003988 [Paraburkholderia sp. MM5384-R2]|nr:hypothetical protein [Paraburkholderia sp. MM5384-R2]